MIEFDPSSLSGEEPPARANLLPTRAGYYLGEDTATGSKVLVELKDGDGRLHTFMGTLGDPERYAPYRELIPEDSVTHQKLFLGMEEAASTIEILELIRDAKLSDRGTAHYAEQFIELIRDAVKLAQQSTESDWKVEQ